MTVLIKLIYAVRYSFKLLLNWFFFSFSGNCNPSFMRSTMYNIPCTSDMLKNSHIPLALTVSPFAKLQPEEVRQTLGSR